jgi:hypothetical protein
MRVIITHGHAPLSKKTLEERSLARLMERLLSKYKLIELHEKLLVSNQLHENGTPLIDIFNRNSNNPGNAIAAIEKLVQLQEWHIPQGAVDQFNWIAKTSGCDLTDKERIKIVRALTHADEIRKNYTTLFGIDGLSALLRWMEITAQFDKLKIAVINSFLVSEAGFLQFLLPQDEYPAISGNSTKIIKSWSRFSC